MEKQVSKFKLVCEYSRALNGVSYSKADRAAKRHLVYYHSADYRLVNGRPGCIRHDLAYLQCIEHIYVYWDYIDVCTLYMYEAGKEITIGFWNKANFSEHSLCELILEKKNAHVLCVGVTPLH